MSPMSLMGWYTKLWLKLRLKHLRTCHNILKKNTLLNYVQILRWNLLKTPSQTKCKCTFCYWETYDRYESKYKNQPIHQVCTPSRAALLTGRWLNLKYGINHNLNKHLGGFWQNVKTCSTLIIICGFLIMAPMLDTLFILADSIVHWNPSVLVVYPQVKVFFKLC